MAGMAIPLPERLERMARWYGRENDRPLVGFTLGSYFPLIRYPEGSKNLDGVIGPQDVEVARFLDDTDHLYQMYEQAGGDFVFSAAPFFGLPWLEAAVGCGVVADHTTGSTRSIAPPDFASHPVVPEFSESNPWVAKLLEFIPVLAERSAGRYPVGTTLMRGIADILSGLYGGGEFVLRMIDSPEEMKSVIAALTRFWVAFGRCLMEHLPLFHGGTGSFHYALWSPGKLIWLQEDAAALLSPRMYEEFILPADRELAASFEHTVFHLHPTKFIPTKYLVETSLSAIEMHIDSGGPSAENLAGHYRTVLARKPLYIWGDVTEADLEFVLTALPGQGLAINVVVESVEQADHIWELAQAVRARPRRTVTG
jgi:hypothetical protein